MYTGDIFMKSILEEASSISKAIENAWKRANQPTEFSVRIHELAEKNIFGFTSKPAKIALFFSEEPKKNAERKAVSHTSSTNPIPQSGKSVTVKSTPKKNAPKEAPQNPAKQPAPAQQKNTRADGAEPWTDEMVSYAQNWLKDLLGSLNLLQSSFRVEPERYHLKVIFAEPIFTEDEKNRLFFRNCAHLIIQATRNKFKRPLKGFKAILTTGQ